MRRSAFIATSVLAALVLMVILPPRSVAVTVEKGDRAPIFENEVLDGERYDLKEHLGRDIILLNFWSVFCRDCLSRVEALNKIADLYQRRNFQLVSICGDPPTERMLAQVRKYAAKMHFPVVLDPELSIFTSYGVESIPFAVLIDTDGRVVIAVQSLEPEPIKTISDAIDRMTKEK